MYSYLTFRSLNDESLDFDIVKDLKVMLDECNTMVKMFRMANDMIEHNKPSNVKIRLIRRRNKDVGCTTF